MDVAKTVIKVSCSVRVGSGTFMLLGVRKVIYLEDREEHGLLTYNIIEPTTVFSLYDFRSFSAHP